MLENFEIWLHAVFGINGSKPLIAYKGLENTSFLSENHHKMPEGTHKLSYIQLKDKVKGHGAKFKGIYKFISMNNYNRYVYLTLFQTYLHF